MNYCAFQMTWWTYREEFTLSWFNTPKVAEGRGRTVIDLNRKKPVFFFSVNFTIVQFYLTAISNVGITIDTDRIPLGISHLAYLGKRWRKQTPQFLELSFLLTGTRWSCKQCNQHEQLFRNSRRLSTVPTQWWLTLVTQTEKGIRFRLFYRHHYLYTKRMLLCMRQRPHSQRICRLQYQRFLSLKISWLIPDELVELKSVPTYLFNLLGGSVTVWHFNATMQFSRIKMALRWTMQKLFKIADRKKQFHFKDWEWLGRVLK